MMGFVVIAGLFEPGTAVKLFEVRDESVLRVEGDSGYVGRRVVDGEGNVGFDGLSVGQRFIARGHPLEGSYPLEVRAIGLSEDDASELMQAPLKNVAGTVGGGDTVPVEPPPAPPGAILQSGVPSGVPLGVV